MRWNRTWMSIGRVVALAGLLAILPGVAAANETDQFTLPVDREFADVGPYLSYVHYRILEDVVAEINADIARARAIADPQRREAQMERLHSPLYVANAVRRRFAPGFIEQVDIEDALRMGAAKRKFGDSLTAYRTPGWIYASTHLPIDPRKLILLFQSSTIQAYGVYFGTDKLAHFHDLGNLYFKDYWNARREGHSHEEALDRMLSIYVRGAISESGIIGLFATGVRSNADLASNYLGFKFYRNLTEPVMLKGRQVEPMLVLRNGFWRLNLHVRPESDFFEAFISDHLNEALNPNVYEFGIRGAIRHRLEKQADDILTFYSDEQGQVRDREWFEARAEELATYYGEYYGHSGMDKVTVTIANACFSEADAVELEGVRASESEIGPNVSVRQ